MRRLLILPARALTHHVAGFSGSLTRWTRCLIVTMCNLANLNAAMRGGLLDLIEVQSDVRRWWPDTGLWDATAFLAAFQPMIEMARRRRLQ